MAKTKRRPVRTAIAKALLGVPFLRRVYSKRLLTELEEKRPRDLPEELRVVQAAIQRLPKAQRVRAPRLCRGPPHRGRRPVVQWVLLACLHRASLRLQWLSWVR